MGRVAETKGVYDRFSIRITVEIMTYFIITDLHEYSGS